jgi:hypothetical protein
LRSRCEIQQNCQDAADFTDRLRGKPGGFSLGLMR